MIKPRQIHVFVRHCMFSSNNKGRPSWFCRKTIFEKLLATKDENTHITVIFDTTSGREDEHFVSKYPGVNVIGIDSGCETISFTNMVQHILKQTNIADDDIVYSVEDDYLHHVGWPKALREAFDQLGEKITYVTLYDHPDKYGSQYKSLQSTVYHTNSCHWRSTPSTTNTYALRFRDLKKHAETHLKFSKPEHKNTFDHAKFVHLQNDLGHVLISSIPAYSTHVEDNMLSPCIDWKKVLMEDTSSIHQSEPKKSNKSAAIL